jgi:hypothetical protein
VGYIGYVLAMNPASTSPDSDVDSLSFGFLTRCMRSGEAGLAVSQRSTSKMSCTHGVMGVLQVAIVAVVLPVCRSPVRLNASPRKAAGLNAAADPSVRTGQRERRHRALQEALPQQNVAPIRVSPHAANNDRGRAEGVAMGA